MLLLVVADDDADRAVTTIQQAAFTGNFGDGVIFISEVEAANTIRTATPGLWPGGRHTCRGSRRQWEGMSEATLLLSRATVAAPPFSPAAAAMVPRHSRRSL
jgi:hypothetical protein